MAKQGSEASFGS